MIVSYNMGAEKEHLCMSGGSRTFYRKAKTIAELISNEYMMEEKLKAYSKTLVRIKFHDDGISLSLIVGLSGQIIKLGIYSNIKLDWCLGLFV